MELREAIVLKSLDYKDSSKILYLYTESGLQSIIAHGVKKMNSINRFLSQNGNLIKVSFSKGNFPSLKEGQPFGHLGIHTFWLQVGHSTSLILKWPSPRKVNCFPQIRHLQLEEFLPTRFNNSHVGIILAPLFQPKHLIHSLS